MIERRKAIEREFNLDLIKVLSTWKFTYMLNDGAKGESLGKDRSTKRKEQEGATKL